MLRYRIVVIHVEIVCTKLKDANVSEAFHASGGSNLIQQTIEIAVSEF